MTPPDLTDFFLGSAGVAGALIGLLFVAISISTERLSRSGAATAHRVRATAALTAFTNVLAVSLFALIPGHKLGPAALAVGAGGLAFVVASLISLARQTTRILGAARDALFLVGLTAAFAIQVIEGAVLMARGTDEDAASNLAILVIVIALLGIGRTWELIGGPTFGLRHEVAELLRHPDKAAPGKAEGGGP